MKRTLCVTALLFLVVSAVTAQPTDDPGEADLGASVTRLESQLAELQTETREHDEAIRRLDSLIDDAEEAGFIMFFFGVFCALWAQNTQRSPWTWFLLGVFFNVITVLFLLRKNSEDIARRAELAQSKT